MTKKIIVLLTAFIAFAMLLTGCKRQVQNPLLNRPVADVKNFINKAETYANQHAKLDLKAGQTAPKNLYYECAKNLTYLHSASGKGGYPPCRTYLLSMVDYAQSTKDYRGVTMDWLTDSLVLQRLYPEKYGNFSKSEFKNKK